jgi:hypothetical protein
MGADPASRVSRHDGVPHVTRIMATVVIPTAKASNAAKSRESFNIMEIRVMNFHPLNHLQPLGVKGSG